MAPICFLFLTRHWWGHFWGQPKLTTNPTEGGRGWWAKEAGNVGAVPERYRNLCLTSGKSNLRHQFYAILENYFRYKAEYTCHVPPAKYFRISTKSLILVVQEAVQFCVTVCEFSVANSVSGVRKMLPLVWSTDPAIKDAVVQAYRRLYLNPQGDTIRCVHIHGRRGFFLILILFWHSSDCSYVARMCVFFILLGWKPRPLWTVSLNWWWMRLWERFSVLRK